MHHRARPTRLALAIIFASLTILSSSADAASPWLDPGYLYRYLFWGIGHPKSDDWKLFPHHEVQNAPPAFHFAAGPPNLVPSTVDYYDGDTLKHAGLDDLLRSTNTHAFIVIRDGQRLYENYFNGYQRDSICISRSIAKSFTSALIGIAIAEGFIKNVNDPITNYLPELKDPRFGSITIRNLLTMTSGIRYRLGAAPWDEEQIAYFHPMLSDVLRDDLAVAEPPGESFHYNEYNTELLGLILRRTTRQSPSLYLQEKIWKPLGMEYPATWSIDSDHDDLELMFTLINARAIDFAKFGQLYLDRGRWNGRQIVHASWVADSTTHDPADDHPWQTYPDFRDDGGYYKYSWWGRTFDASNYVFEAIGVSGQYIFVAPKQKMVIVRTGADWGSIGPAGWQKLLRYIVEHTGEIAATPAPSP